MQIITAALTFASAVTALNPITIKGNAFYDGNTRFYIRGIDYQPGGSSNITDPLADTETCKRDIKYFKDLGVNTIRVYTADNSINHDECMKELEKAGIYLLLDVNSPRQSLNRLDADSLKASYNSGYLQHVFATIDAFKGYSNTLGFFAANEVINNVTNTIAAPYIKAVVRDMKAYIKAQSKREIPVGYSAADISENRWEQMCYLNCGDKEDERIDMFGMNDYSWCGEASSFVISGWSRNVKAYSNYSIPLFLSEYGCNKVRPRTFPEVKSLYSTDMSPVYSGGLVYEYSNADNDYGLVEIKDNKVTKLPDYENFKVALANAPNPTGQAGAKSSSSPESCPAFKKGKWEVDPTEPLPQMPKYAKKFLKNGAGKPLGLKGPNTQSGSQLDIPDAQKSSSSSSTNKPHSTGQSESGSKNKSKSKNSGSILSGANSGITAIILGLAAYF